MENQNQPQVPVKNAQEKIAKAKEQQKTVKHISKLEAEIIVLKKQIENKQKKIDELANSL
jgi:predicted RNase H-like nuclease (RuvC/YqgF family)